MDYFIISAGTKQKLDLTMKNQNPCMILTTTCLLATIRLTAK
jgi:hypothetical protein